jgi:transcriptional regulator with XRE-family HTH domain
MAVYTHLDTDYAANHVGARIRAARKRGGFTLYDLASRVSVSVATLSGIENQKATVDVGLLVALTKALNLSVWRCCHRVPLVISRSHAERMSPDHHCR